MTIAMPDAIVPATLPGGYPAYLGYLDGFWPTYTELASMFPSAHQVILTVRGGSAAATGCDVESGDLTPSGGVEWADGQLRAGAWRPVIYASADTMTTSIIPGLERVKIPLASVRLLSAHYGLGEHICGPATCGAIPVAVDGTQWTDGFPGVGGALIDMSALNDDFFAAPGEWVFGPVRSLQVLAVGPSSVRLSWDSPEVPEPGAVVSYQVTIRKDGDDLPSYPRSEVKGGNPEDFQFGSLPAGTALTAMVRAMGANGSHASAWASVEFTTPR